MSAKKPKRGVFTEGNTKITIQSDLRPRQFKYGYEVPKSVMARQFDHLEDGEDSDGFFKHKNHWYHISDFMRYGHHGWTGYASDSYFSGTLLWLSPDGEEYIVGTYTS